MPEASTSSSLTYSHLDTDFRKPSRKRFRYSVTFPSELASWALSYGSRLFPSRLAQLRPERLIGANSIEGLVRIVFPITLSADKICCEAELILENLTINILPATGQIMLRKAEGKVSDES